MSYYNFHVRNNIDNLGYEAKDCTTLQAARRAAVGLADQILDDYAAEVWVQDDWRVDVEDEVGLVVFSLRLSKLGSLALGG